jgi:hypothetical protein
MTAAPLSLLMLLAHHADGTDPHLTPGVHLRWFSAPPLGLPVEVFQVERADASEFREFQVDQVNWFGRFGGLSVPFTLNPGEEAFGLLPAGEDAVAAEVRFDPAQSAGLTGVGEVATPNGYETSAVMAPNGWLLSPGIQRLRLRGPGRIVGAGWLSISRMEDNLSYGLVAKVGLPSGPAARYNGTPDFENAAVDRVFRGAPLRRGLHDDPDASSPASAAPADPDGEKERVLSLARPDLEKVLDTLLNDLSDLPIRLESKEDLEGGVTGDVPLLTTLLHALVDPGLARWLGFAELDRDNLQAMVLYRVTGVYRMDEVDRSLLSAAQRAFLPDQDKFELRAYCLAHPSPDFASPPPRAIAGAAAETGPWISGGDRLVRLSSVRFTLPPGHMDFLAWRRGKPGGGGGFESLNEVDDDGFHLPLAASQPPGVADPRFRRLRDASVPPEPQEYGVAAADVFGRWSEWAPALLPEGVTVPPPTPVVEADYLAADRDPVDDSPRAGRVRCHTRLPEALAPGTPTITTARFRLLSLDGAVETPLDSREVPVGTGALEAEHIFTGPGLGRGEHRTLVVRLRFLSGGLLSEESAAQLVAADPRPPAPIVIVPDVQYTTRPDGRGQSTVRLRWAPGAGHAAYRVYRSSQRSLEPFLASLGPAGQEALELVRDPTAPHQAVATAIQAHAAILPKDSFELITREVVRPIGGECSHGSALPGRSRMLHLYRLLAVNAAGVEEDWDGPPALVYVAVPLSIRLQPPGLEAGLAGGAIRVRVLASPGQPAAAVRMFRSTNPAATLEQMTRVLEAPIPPPSGGSGQELTLLDEGASPFNPTGTLREWSRYTYRAQLQAPSQPGEPPGIWSDPSAPAALHYLPPAPPPAPTITGVTRTGDQVTLRWENPELRIRATSLGNHQYRVLRAKAGGGVMEELATVDALLPPELTDPDASGGVRYVYVVETVDPLGRRAASARSDEV